LFFSFFHPPATPAIYTLSLHDALPISGVGRPPSQRAARGRAHREETAPVCGEHRAGLEVGTDRDEVSVGSGRIRQQPARRRGLEDRKSTRLNSSHSQISYAVFCLKKKT